MFLANCQPRSGVAFCDVLNMLEGVCFLALRMLRRGVQGM